MIRRVAAGGSRESRPARRDAERHQGTSRGRRSSIAAVNAAFAPADEMTAAFVALWNGQTNAERYAPGITRQTPLESRSMGKSTTATLIGLLMRQGVMG